MRNLLTSDPDEIERLWYVPPDPQYHPGWLLFSRSFVLESLQGCVYSPELVNETPTRIALATLVCGAMGVTQGILMLVSRIPILNWLMYALARNLPRTSIGFFVRGCYWKPRLAFLGQDTLIDQGVEFTTPRSISIGNRCHIDRDVVISVGQGDGYVHIKDHVFIGRGGHIAGRGGVVIESFVGISARVHIYSVTNTPYDINRPGELISMSHSIPQAQQSTITGEVTIGPYAVIGLGNLILPGVTIGKGAVTHAYAEITRAVPKFAVMKGFARDKQQGWRRPGRLDARLPVERERVPGTGTEALSL
jgi:galactoside O-acetyltransferase